MSQNRYKHPAQRDGRQRSILKPLADQGMCSYYLPLFYYLLGQGVRRPVIEKKTTARFVRKSARLQEIQRLADNNLEQSHTLSFRSATTPLDQEACFNLLQCHLI